MGCLEGQKEQLKILEKCMRMGKRVFLPQTTSYHHQGEIGMAFTPQHHQQGGDWVHHNHCCGPAPLHAARWIFAKRGSKWSFSCPPKLKVVPLASQFTAYSYSHLCAFSLRFWGIYGQGLGCVYSQAPWHLAGCAPSHSVVSDSLQPRQLQPARLLCPRNSPSKKTGVGSTFASPRDLPNPGIESMFLVSPALQGDSLPLHHLGSRVISKLIIYWLCR